MCGMDLYHLESRLHRTPRRGFECFDDLRDPFRRQLCRLRITLVKCDRAWRHRRPCALLHQLPAVPGLRHTCLTPRMRQLDADLTTLRPNELHDPPQPVNMLILPDPQIGRTDTPFRRNCRCFRKDQPRPADRPAPQMHQVPVVRHPIPRTVLTHGRNNDPIVEGNISYQKRSEQLTHNKMLLRS